MWRRLFPTPARALDENEKAMKVLAEHFLAQPNRSSELIDLCQKVLIMCARREGKRAPVFPDRNWQDGHCYLLAANGKKGPAVPCQFIEHDYAKVEIKGPLHLHPHVAGGGVRQKVVLVDSAGIVIIQGHLPVMQIGQCADFRAGPLVSINTD